MNLAQKIVLVVVGALVLAMLLFPPFQFRRGDVNRNLGYAFILDPPEAGYQTGTVNVPMLLTQWAGVIVLGGIGVLVTKDLR